METLEFTTIYLMCRSAQSQVFKKKIRFVLEFFIVQKTGSKVDLKINVQRNIKYTLNRF